MLGFYYPGQTHLGDSGFVSTDDVIVTLLNSQHEITSDTLTPVPTYVISLNNTVHEINDSGIAPAPTYVISLDDTAHEITSDTLELYQLLQSVTLQDSTHQITSSKLSLAPFVTVRLNDSIIQITDTGISVSVDAKLFNGLQWVNRPLK